MSKIDIIRIINHYQNLNNHFVNIAESDLKEVSKWIANGITKDELCVKLFNYGLI